MQFTDRSHLNGENGREDKEEKKKKIGKSCGPPTKITISGGVVPVYFVQVYNIPDQGCSGFKAHRSNTGSKTGILYKPRHVWLFTGATRLM